MYPKVKDYEEPLPKEALEIGSKWKLIFDGVVNAYSKGIWAIIVTPHGSHIPFTARLTFECTNNMAKYEACITGLEEAMNLRIKFLDVYRDSALVINEIKGEWDIEHPGLLPYKDYARSFLPFFDKVEFYHIPQDENQMADTLATLASMYKVNFPNEMPHIKIMHLDRLVHVFAVEEVNNDNPWFHDIRIFLQSQ
ncbi:uncharacterized protein LOC131619610 [Vicia villosa]|uniref:uncharacterized protein LOC131619610 n=1 Tax=Vicia villosa TaxID=3911 RepID=UPI00273B7327|nr:uncharacterized protein LOC131619610 [Vicia villosa]